MTETQTEKIGDTPAYWTHKVSGFPDPVAVTRMAQLIDFDDRLYEAARITYRFLINWYHRDHGDALLSMRNVSKVMKARTPQSSATLSHSAVRRAIIALMETGWVVRTVKGRGKGKTASRYVPTLNVLDLATLGKFPELLHANEPVQPGAELFHANGAVAANLLHANGAVQPELLHANGAKTHLPDMLTLDMHGRGKGNTVSAAADAPGASAPGAAAGFERIWQAYGRYGSKQASKAAFALIDDPDVEHIATRATSWAASAKPGRKRIPLERWLAEERYDEADRAVTKTSKPASNDNTQPDEDARKVVAARSGKIMDAAPDGRLLRLTLQDKAGEAWESIVVVESDNHREQERGQRELSQIWAAGGAAGVLEDPADLRGIRLELRRFSDGAVEWRAAA